MPSLHPFTFLMLLSLVISTICAQISIGSRLAPIELAAVAILFAEDVSSSVIKILQISLLKKSVSGWRKKALILPPLLISGVRWLVMRWSS